MVGLWPKHTGWWLAAALALVGFGLTFSLTRELVGALLAWAFFGAAAAIVLAVLLKKRVRSQAEKATLAAQIIVTAAATMFLLALPVWIYPFQMAPPSRAKIRISSRQIGLPPGGDSIIANIHLTSDGPAQAFALQHFAGMRFVPAPFEGLTQMSITKTKANEETFFGDLGHNLSQATEPTSALPVGRTQFFTIPGPKLLPAEMQGKQVNRDGQVLLVGGIVTYRDRRGAPRREIEFCFYLLSSPIQVSCFGHNSED